MGVVTTMNKLERRKGVAKDRGRVLQSTRTNSCDTRKDPASSVFEAHKEELCVKCIECWRQQRTQQLTKDFGVIEKEAQELFCNGCCVRDSAT